MNEFETIGFGPADILIPKKNINLEKWCVVACDQYTSEPEYWKETEKIVDNAPSTFYQIFPEIYLDQPGFETRIRLIHETMLRYLNDGIFTEYPQALILTKRTQADGKIRTGLIGAVDLEHYDYNKGSATSIRATEGTVLERIPPRVRVRKNAPLELPHIMLLIDDKRKTVIEPLERKKENYHKLYETQLMQNGGNVEGYLVDPADYSSIASAFKALANPEEFSKRYGKPSYENLVFAVGDGNHSLATAKACYEALKEEKGESAKYSPARYALVELVNLHDPSLEFEAIHRVVFDVEPEHLLSELQKQLGAVHGKGEGHTFTCLYQGKKQELTVPHPQANLTVGTLQTFLDRYLAEFGGRVDYIHGAEVTERLSNAPRAIGFLLPDMLKSELYPTVILDGSIPRKTFSMGHAWDKRYYLEARKIR